MTTGVVPRSGIATNLKRAFANASAGGNTLLVAAPTANQKIRVISMVLITSGIVSVKLQSNVTDITSLKALAANGGYSLAGNELGWYETAKGDPLNVNLSGAIAVGVDISYVIVN